MEFLRRLSHHILPRGFVRIRHFGFLTNTRRSALLAVARQLIVTVLPSVEVCAAAAVDHKTTWQCPHCRAPMRIGSNLSASQLRSRCLSFDSS
ncbi:MAG: transposase [Acidobacteriaceae bacterium]|nr:transposase [Acidobacteriaceae bacterium]